MRSDLDVYDDLLRLQADASFDLEQSAIGSDAWLAAESVLDLGCGNSAYTRLLAERYKEKNFVGLEPDPGLFGRAAGGTAPNLRVLQGTLDDLPTGFRTDALLLRLMLMYVRDIPAIARWASENSSMTVVVNPDDELFEISPPLARFTDVLALNPGRIASLGGRRDSEALTIESWERTGHELVGSHSVVVSSRPEWPIEKMHHLMLLNAEMIYETPLPEPLYREVYEWALDPTAHIQYGFRIHRFINRRTASRIPGQRDQAQIKNGMDARNG